MSFIFRQIFQENNFYNFILKHNTRASTGTVLTLIAEIGRHFNLKPMLIIFKLIKNLKHITLDKIEISNCII